MVFGLALDIQILKAGLFIFRINPKTCVHCLGYQDHTIYCITYRLLYTILLLTL